MRIVDKNFATVSFVVVLLGAAATAAGQTPIPGGVINTATWTPAGSPYVIYGDTHVAGGATLTVEPGVVVTFMPTDLAGGGVDPSRVEFDVEAGGVLLVLGTAQAPVEFRANEGSGPGIWYGIASRADNGEITLENATITDAVTALTMQSFSGHAAVHNVEFTGNSTDIEIADFSSLSVTGTLTASRIVGNLELYGNATFLPGSRTTSITGDLTLGTGGVLQAALRSTSSSDRLQVTGGILLEGDLLLDLADLQVDPGAWVYLIENDGTDAIVGSFDGRPEGSVWTAGGREFGISYRDGTGNDVTLTLDPAPWPAPQQWEPIVDRSSDGFRLLQDPAGDAGQPLFDLVGDSNDPLAFLATDESYYYLRVRLAGSPLIDPLRYATVVIRALLEFDFVGGPVSYDYDIQFSGADEMVTVRRNTAESADWCNDLPEEDVLTYFVTPRTFGDLRIVPAGSVLGGGEDQFVDLRIPRVEWESSVGPPPAAATRIVLGTSTNAAQINRDTAILGCADSWSLGVGDVPDEPGAALTLHQNTPNPFNPGTEIRFDLPAAQRISLYVHDLAGRLVSTLASNEALPAGRHALTWDGRDGAGRTVAAGTYLYRLVAGEASVTKRMLLIK